MKSIRILLVDDHAWLIDAVKNLLEGDFEVIGSARDGEDVLDMATKLNPDVILLDLTMPGWSGLEAVQKLKKKSPAATIVFLTTNEDREIAAEALRLGAGGYVLKKSAASDLRPAIHAALTGQTFLSPALSGRSAAPVPRY